MLGETCDPPDSENCYSNSTIGTVKQFFGVIDEAGFERFEYRELEGKLERDGAEEEQRPANCPIFGAKRMADSSAFLVSGVLPHKSIRQWVFWVCAD